MEYAPATDTPEEHDPDQFNKLRTFLAKQGITFTRISKDFVNVPGRGRNLSVLNKREGKYVVQVAINYPLGDPRVADDPEPIRPCMSYDGEVLKDWAVTGKHHIVTDEDRVSQATARAVFFGIYKGCRVTVENVYLLEVKP